MNLPVRAPIIDPVSAFRQRVAVRIPTREGLAGALSAVPRIERSGLGLPYGGRRSIQSPRTYDAPRWFLSVSPGSVKVHRRLVAPKERFRWDDDDVTMLDDRPTRGAITEFSDDSRANMHNTLAQLDYTPMFAPGARSAMVTLTLPGQEWERLVPDLRTFKDMVRQFQRIYKRAWGHMPIAVWKMEFQRRGAPHLHLFMCPPEGLSRGRGVKGGRTFMEWIGLAWADIVDPARSGPGYRDHAMFGTRVDYIEGLKFSDPRRIAAYFSKHGAFRAKDYQNDMPEHWRAAILENGGGGARFWGYWQLEKAIETLELGSSSIGRPPHRERRIDGEPVMHRHRQPSPLDLAGETLAGNHSYVSDDDETPEHVKVMRHLRKLARRQSFVAPVTVVRMSVNEATGEVKLRRRKVRRRKVYLANQSSGFLIVNDGEAAARDIARLLGFPPPSKSDLELAA